MCPGYSVSRWIAAQFLNERVERSIAVFESGPHGLAEGELIVDLLLGEWRFGIGQRAGFGRLDVHFMRCLQ